MPGSVQDLQLDAADTEDFTILHALVLEHRRRRAMQDDRRLGGGDEVTVAGDMVGVRVRLEHVGDAKTLLAGDPEVVRHAVAAGIDDDRLPRLAASDEVREAPRLLVHELLEDHRPPSAWAPF